MLLDLSDILQVSHTLTTAALKMLKNSRLVVIETNHSSDSENVNFSDRPF